jgi:DNA mismatch repair protein MutH
MKQLPKNETELLQRAQILAGSALGELAFQHNIDIPIDSLYGKGWSGLLMELLLGATAGSLAEPDFQHLGIELKTIPINESGKPLESTYVSIVPLTRFIGLQWEDSEIYAKLKRILWVPLAAGKNIPLAERRIGMPFLWSPDILQLTQLKQDWQELMDKVALGELEKISSHMGKYLQIRPKAANASSRCWGFDEEGKRVLVLPRGFYLRTSFTQMILKQNFG